MQNQKLNPASPWQLVPQLSVKTLAPAKCSATVHNAKQAYTILKPIWQKDSFLQQEQWLMLAVDDYNQVQGARRVNTGHVTAQNIDVSIMTASLVHTAASGIIIARNEPYRSLATIENDCMLLGYIKMAMGAINIRVMDFIICHQRGFLSFWNADDDIETRILVGYKKRGQL